MEPQLITLQDDGIFPNSRLPVVLYKNSVDADNLSMVFEQLFKQNNWFNSWEAGIFTSHHYHSNTHEAIGVCHGITTLLLGGEKSQAGNYRNG